MIRLHGQQFWLYGAVDPYTNEILEPLSDHNETDDAMVSDRSPAIRLNDVEFRR